MTKDWCQECGDAGWVWYWETPKARTLVPCFSCIDAGRVIPPNPEGAFSCEEGDQFSAGRDIPSKPVREIDEELDEVGDYIGWEEV